MLTLGQSRALAEREIKALETQFTEAKKVELRNYVTQAKNGFYFIYRNAARETLKSRDKQSGPGKYEPTGIEEPGNLCSYSRKPPQEHQVKTWHLFNRWSDPICDGTRHVAGNRCRILNNPPS